MGRVAPGSTPKGGCTFKGGGTFKGGRKNGENRCLGEVAVMKVVKGVLC